MTRLDRLVRLCRVLFDRAEFLSPHGLRSLSAAHRDHPYVLDVEGVRADIDYEPAESTTAMFGGNSNWRGPVWFPLNYLMASALERYHEFFGADLTIEYPTGSETRVTLDAVAADVWARLVSIFTADRDGRRPCFGGVDRLQTDPRWHNNLLFFEYFHGDNGAGLGACHQTGWTGLVADVIRRRHRACPTVSRSSNGLCHEWGMMPVNIAPGRPDPLGATPDPRGTNFAVASGGDEVTLCLFDTDGAETQLVLPDRDGDVHHGFVPGVEQGQAYGFRVSGAFDPGAACGTTPRSCFWTRTRARSRARCGSGPRSLATQSIIRRRQARWTQQLMCRAAWFAPRRRPCPRRSRSTRLPTPSSTKFTFAGSPRPIRACPQS